MTIIEQIVHRSKLTRSEIAAGMNCTERTLYTYIRNPKQMSVADIEKLADVLDRSPRNLFSLIINN